MTQTRFKLPPRAEPAGAEIRPSSRPGGNLQAVLAVHAAMLDGACAIARHNLETFWQTMAALTQAPWASATPARTGIEASRRATASLKDLADIIHHANAEALDVLNRRLTEALEEVTRAAGDRIARL